MTLTLSIAAEVLLVILRCRRRVWQDGKGGHLFRQPEDRK
jgi:hypothetical protein